jgi:hypothetical protein
MRSLAIAQPGMPRTIFTFRGETDAKAVGSESPKGVLPILSLFD